MLKTKNYAIVAAMFAIGALGACSKKEAPTAPATDNSTATSAASPAPAENKPASESAAPAPASTEAPAVAMETAPAPPSTPVKTEAPATEASPSAPPATPAPSAAEATPPAPAPAANEAAPAPAPAVATTTAEATPPSKAVDGAPIVQGICFACHQAGMNGAPKFANKIAWGSRIAQGRDKLYEHAMKGLRGMPPRGGNPNLSDDEVKAAVDYMVKAAGGYPN